MWTRWRRSRQMVWGRDASSLSRVFDGDDLDQLLAHGHGVQVVDLHPASGEEHWDVERVRRANKEWLGRWEATIPPESGSRLPSWQEFPRLMDRRQEEGTALSMVLTVDREIAGLISVGAVERGAMQMGGLGYWIAQKWAGKGITSLAAAATIDLVVGDLGLHRLEVNVRPENVPSLALARKLGLREEGYRRRYMHIDNQWADHVGFAVDQQDLGALAEGSLVEARIRRYHS